MLLGGRKATGDDQAVAALSAPPRHLRRHRGGSMANNAVPGGKVAGKGRVGGGRWRRSRGSGSDDGSDEEYVLGDDGEAETESSDDSYASDASKDAAREPEEEEEEEEEFDLVDEVEIEVSKGRRRAIADFVAAGVGADIPPLRKRRLTLRRHPTVPTYDEEDDCNDADDEDFAPDEDEDEEEEIANPPARRAGCRKSGSLKLHRKRGRPGNSNLEGKRSRAPATKRRKVSRVVVSSEDDDFVVRGRRRISVEATAGERKKRGKVWAGRKRQHSWLSRSDRSKSDSSDLDRGISGVVPRILCTRRPLVRTPAPSLDSRLEKGKGKDDFDLGGQVCGICLSEEKKKGVIRGLLDCCAHYFCFACIMEWSKVESRCPLCKRRFRTVRKMANPAAGFCPRTTVLKIPVRDQVYEPSEEEIRAYLDPYANVVCMECQQGGDDDLMLLCDICDSPAHTYCAGLGREVPAGNWYCHGCKPMDIGSSTSRVQESMVERGVASGAVRVNSHSQCEVDPDSTPVQMLPEASRRLPSLSSLLSADRIGDGASSRHTSFLEGYETTLGVPGFTAATVSGRRSIHHHIRLMISNNRVRWIPEGIARNSMMQASSTGSEVHGYATERHRETLGFRQQSLSNGMDSGDAFGPFLGIHMFPCTNNEASGSDVVETAKDFNQW